MRNRSPTDHEWITERLPTASCQNKWQSRDGNCVEFPLTSWLQQLENSCEMCNYLNYRSTRTILAPSSCKLLVLLLRIIYSCRASLIRARANRLNALLRRWNRLKWARRPEEGPTAHLRVRLYWLCHRIVINYAIVCLWLSNCCGFGRPKFRVQLPERERNGLSLHTKRYDIQRWTRTSLINWWKGVLILAYVQGYLRLTMLGARNDKQLPHTHTQTLIQAHSFTRVTLD